MAEFSRNALLHYFEVLMGSARNTLSVSRSVMASNPWSASETTPHGAMDLTQVSWMVRSHGRTEGCRCRLVRKGVISVSAE